MSAVLIECWEGLGDNVYLRPMVRAAVDAGEDVYLKTPWPQLFQDLDVRFVDPDAQYRTQSKNAAAQPPARWSEAPAGIRVVQPTISKAAPSITGGIAVDSPWPVSRELFDLPSLGHLTIDERLQPLAVVRPVVVRTEWENISRNPDPKYVFDAVELLKAGGYQVVAIADLEEGSEWIEEPSPNADSWYMGEPVETVMSLIELADVVVGGVGFILPVAIAYGTPLITIGGGNGGHNAPERLVGYGMDGSKAGWLLPDDYCRCLSYDHECPKHISDFPARFVQVLEEVTTA